MKNVTNWTNQSQIPCFSSKNFVNKTDSDSKANNIIICKNTLYDYWSRTKKQKQNFLYTHVANIK